MRKYIVLRQTLVAFVITAASMASAADAPKSTAPEVGGLALRPASKAVVLRRVPDGSGSIRQVQHEQAENSGRSTTEAESQKVYQANGHQTKAGRNGQTSESLIPKLVLTQHTQESVNSQKRTLQDDRRSKKPGLFRRLFSRFTSDDEDSEGNILPGEPAPGIPKPPPITNGNNGTAGSSVPARAAGYQQQQVDAPPIPGVGATPVQNRAQPLVPEARTPDSGYHKPMLHQQGGQGLQERNPQQQRRPTPRDDGFVSPFDGEGLVQQEDVLLDLDSLIQKETPKKKSVEGAVNELPQIQTNRVAEIVPIVPVKKPVVVSIEQPRGPANGPFTGYRLDSDETVQNNAIPAGLPAETIVGEEVVAVPDESIQNERRGDQTHDLKEPAMQLPPVTIASPSPTGQRPMQSVVIAEPGENVSASPLVEKVPLLQATATGNPFVDTEATDTEATDTEATDTEATDTEATDTEATDEEATEEITMKSASVGFSRPEVAEPDSSSLDLMDGRVQREQQRYRIMARAGQTGFKGFCPVELRDRRDLVDSREKYVAKFGLQTYFFSSPEAKSAFEANPTRYAPAAGGSDVVLLVNTGEELTGALDFSLWYQDRLYMFRSRETQHLFSKDPARYADQY